MNEVISILISLILIIFWIWMLFEMINDPDISSNDRVFWLVGFIFLSLLLPGITISLNTEKLRQLLKKSYLSYLYE